MLELTTDDITTIDVDAIVNAANSALSGGGGVDGAIHRAAGPKLLAACREHGRCQPGDVVVTPGFQLMANWVLHAVGPVWDGGDSGERSVLRKTYESCAAVIEERGLTSVAIPAISCGAYRFPLPIAADIAVSTLKPLAEKVRVVLSCPDRRV